MVFRVFKVSYMTQRVGKGMTLWIHLLTGFIYISLYTLYHVPGKTLRLHQAWAVVFAL